MEALGRPLDIAALNAGRSLGGSFLETDIEDELAMIALDQQVRPQQEQDRPDDRAGEGQIHARVTHERDGRRDRGSAVSVPD
ncbi:hypothetical protein [Nostocoides sp.]